jgi:hypothetical protein
MQVSREPREDGRVAQQVGIGVVGLVQSPSTYVGAVKAQLAHAPVASTLSEKERKVENLRKRERIEPESVAAVSNLGKHASIHNTRATPGEVLPPGLERSCTGFLVSTNIIEAKIDAAKVKKEMEYLSKCVIIAYFVGGLQTAKVLEAWVEVLSREVKAEVKIGRLLGQGFFQLICKEEAATQTVLMHSPHLSRWGTCMLQPWEPGFKPSMGNPKRSPRRIQEQLFGDRRSVGNCDW